MFLVLSLVTTLALAADTGARLDPSLVETELIRQGIALQALEAERDALRAQCAKACVPVVAPAPAPKATPKPAPKSAPKATTTPKPVPAPVATPVVVPNAEIVALREEIEFLRGQLAKPAPAIIVNPTPVQVNVVVPQAAAPDVIVNPIVERNTHTEHTNSIVGFRFHGGLAESVTGAPALPGSNLVVVDRTEVFARGELRLAGDNWVTMEVDAGYGFAQDSTAIRALLGYTRNVGPVDLNVGVGPSYRCDAAFTEGNLCTNSLFGGQGQAGIAFQAFGPVNVEIFGGGGYSAVDSKYAGTGGTGYGFGGARIFLGPVGQETSETVY